MKKKRIILFGSIAAAILIISLTAANIRHKDREIKRPYVADVSYVDSNYIATLKSAGFSCIKEVEMLGYANKRAYWKNKFGLNFLGENEMKQFLEDNDFIMGESEKYKEMIPQKQGVEMLKNLKNIEDSTGVYRFSLENNSLVFFLSRSELNTVPKDDKTLSWVDHYGDYIGKEREAMLVLVKAETMEKYHIPTSTFFTLQKAPLQVMVIGDQKYFNTEGMHLSGRILSDPPKDPIAVVKVDGGYVELANW